MLPLLWISTFLFALLASLLKWYYRRRFRISQDTFRSNLASLRTPHTYIVALILAGSTGLTQHALLTVSSLPEASPIHSFPDLACLYWAAHFGLVVAIVFSDVLSQIVSIEIAYMALFLYSSYVYFRPFFALELGSYYSLLYLLVILLIAPTILNSSHVPFWQPFTSIIAPLFVFLLLAGVATFLSASPAESLNQYLQITCFAVLPFFLARSLGDDHQWRAAARGFVILGSGIWVILAGWKFGLLAGSLGWLTALRYRLFIADVGPNWITHSVAALLPISIAFWLVASGRWKKLLWGLITLGLLLTTIYAQSTWGFSGWIAVGLGIGSFILLVELPVMQTWWRRSATLRLPVGLASAGLLVVMILSIGILASRINSYSLFARIQVWRIAFYEATDHPWLGVGLGVRHVAAAYGNLVSWEDVAAPSISWLIHEPLNLHLLQDQLGFHTHNLFLELAVGAGLPALLAFLWYLWHLGKFGLVVFCQARGEARILIAGCIAGLVSALGWGLIDVMEYSPPFFTTPVWALIGLLLAAPQLIGLEAKTTNEQKVTGSLRVNPFVRGVLIIILLLMISYVFIIGPLMENNYYRIAYTAFQQHRWAEAEAAFAQAARWEPLNPRYQQMRGQAFINLGQYDQALQSYQLALRNKQDFAPYHNQLAWLFWLQGDLPQAINHFQKAVEADPLEAWCAGLHADLALAYVAQGRVQEAIPLFKKTIELNPQLAQAPYWVTARDANGKLSLVLDPTYSDWNDGHGSAALVPRILEHLGKSDYTTRMIGPPPDMSSPISFNQIVDAIGADYEALRRQNKNSLDAMRMLATQAEVARLAGFHRQAKLAYLKFQHAYPESVYGYRGLGNLYRNTGQLEQAQTMLIRALRIDPEDAYTRLDLAQVYMDKEDWTNAEQAFKHAHISGNPDALEYTLQAGLYKRLGDWSAAADMLRKALFINEFVAHRLELATLYSQLGQPKNADRECSLAIEALWKTWPRPLDPLLWDAAVCLAQIEEKDRSAILENLTPKQSLVKIILQGHIERVNGQLEKAIRAYQSAVEFRVDEGEAHYFLGEIFLTLGQFEQAEAEYRESASLSPIETLPRLALGNMQLRQGNRVAAIENFRSVVDLNPGWDEAQMILGNALLTMGRREEAGEHFHQAGILSRSPVDNEFYNFISQLSSADDEVLSQDHIKGDFFVVDGVRKPVLFEHPNSRLSYTVELANETNLAFSLATAPESWTQEGDGVTFTVYIIADGITQQLFSTYIDPKHKVSDRRWHPYVIDLGAYTGKPVTFIFETNAGPAGDYRYDWAGWGEPRVLTK
jgi:tetratricopeptide (TPR) repeat protein